MNNEESNLDNVTKPIEINDTSDQPETVEDSFTAPFENSGYALVLTTKLKREVWLKIPNNFEPIRLRDTVIFDIDREGTSAQHFGTVIRLMAQPTYDPSGRVRRKATSEDQKRIGECLNGNTELEKIFRANVRDEKLPMTLQAIEQGFDGKKITFYYKAEDKVDFRKLVKLLAASCKCRIELYQLSVKEQFMFHSCLGICGLTTCCSRQPGLFERKISPALAKKQKLMFNAAKMSGCCGKPRCCLMYEADQYSEYTNDLPRVNSLVEYNSDEFRVVDWDYCHETITLEHTDPDKENAQEVVSTSELSSIKPVTTPRNYSLHSATISVQAESQNPDMEKSGIHDIYYAPSKEQKSNGRTRPDNP